MSPSKITRLDSRVVTENRFKNNCYTYVPQHITSPNVHPYIRTARTSLPLNILKVSFRLAIWFDKSVDDSWFAEMCGKYHIRVYLHYAFRLLQRYFSAVINSTYKETFDDKSKTSCGDWSFFSMTYYHN